MKSFIAIAAVAATASAFKLSARDVTWNYNATCNGVDKIAKVVNRCSYPVFLWSIDKQMGCPDGTGLELKPGQFYHEDLRNGSTPNDGGISVKISKFPSCGGKDITQLEYKMSYEQGYEGNYLDMSFVDCVGNLEDCPGRTDGFYFQAGNQDGKFLSAVDNQHCPIFNVYNAEEAAQVSYINWNDPQTKWCNLDANVELYLCGGEAPSAGDEAGFSSAPAPSTPIKSSSSAQSSSSSSSSSDDASAPSTTDDAYIVAAAAVTPAPVAPVIKTEVVYVTEYVKKRHAHGRRHQHFNA